MMTKTQKRSLFWANVFSTLINIPIAIYQAFVASQLWGWFVMANFSVPNLTIVDFLGLILFFNLLLTSMYIFVGLSNIPESYEKKMEQIFCRLFAWVLIVSLTLLTGYIYHLFM